MTKEVIRDKTDGGNITTEDEKKKSYRLGWVVGLIIGLVAGIILGAIIV